MNDVGLAGSNAGTESLEQVVRELAASDTPVLLRAEPGAGKRTTAVRIHQLSARRNQTLARVDCATLTPEALQSGAASLFSSGTVLLEEVANLSAEAQAKLLEILPRIDASRHGGARLIFTTTRDLEAEVQAGRFREDLYYRINGIALSLPPLRQRREDIPRLTEFFLQRFAREMQRPVPQLSEETQRWLQEYGWPGNVRELEGAMKAMVVQGEGGNGTDKLPPGPRPRRVLGERLSLKEASRAASREAERELILQVLNRTRWNRRRAAQELQISYKALLYKLKQIGCEEYGAS
jgi:DNA-binding NtrC family response regulator